MSQSTAATNMSSSHTYWDVIPISSRTIPGVHPTSIPFTRDSESTSSQRRHALTFEDNIHSATKRPISLLDRKFYYRCCDTQLRKRKAETITRSSRHDILVAPPYGLRVLPMGLQHAFGCQMSNLTFRVRRIRSCIVHEGYQ
jgi:hypothetical protein